METAEHREALRTEGRLLADAAERAGPGAGVPTCPEWRVRDLLIHTGRIHRWATRFVADGLTEPTRPPEAAAPADEELVPWFREGHARLVETLAAAPPGLACWSFLPAPSPLAFWTRRQAHETAVHRADAEAASGTRSPVVSPAFAADGIDELLAGFHARERSRVRTPAPRVLRIRTTDTADVWTVRLSEEPPRTERSESGAADCEIAGPAADVYLTLWNRPSAGAPGITGDASLAELWKERSGI